MRYRLAIFDFDGTLADTFPVLERLLAEVSERYQLTPLAEAELAALRGLDTTAVLRAMGVSRARLPAMLRHGRRRIAAHRDAIRLFPGIDRLVAALHDGGTAVSIVSSNAEETVRAVLGTALEARVHSFACGVGVFGKAAKVRSVLRAAEVPAAQAVYVGDEARDMTAARRSGVGAVAVTWGWATEAAFVDADMLCRTVADLAAALGVRTHEWSG